MVRNIFALLRAAGAFLRVAIHTRTQQAGTLALIMGSKCDYMRA